MAWACVMCWAWGNLGASRRKIFVSSLPPSLCRMGWPLPRAVHGEVGLE